MSERRLLLVHAHPDDESTATGATMARYAAEGAKVSLVTCTSGELGEVVPDDLAYLRDDPAALGKHRRAELTEALPALGVRHHHWLGGPGRWRDSGMAGSESNAALDAFASAAPDEIIREMVGLLRAERPHVVITYDDHGGYGHPDHIAANRALMRSLDPAADGAYAPELGEPWAVPKVYWQVLPQSFLDRAKEAGIEGFEPHAVPDRELTAIIDGRAHHEAKLAALREHRSQVDLDDGGFFASIVAIPDFALEHYVLVRGTRGPGDEPEGPERDLFSGLGAKS